MEFINQVFIIDAAIIGGSEKNNIMDGSGWR